MNSTKLVLNSVLSFYDTGYSNDSWTNALDAMAALVEVKGILMYATSHLDELGYNIAGTNSFSENISADLYDYKTKFADTSRYHLGSKWLDHTKNVPVYTPVYDTDVWSLEEYNSHPEIQWLRNRLGVHRRFSLGVSNGAEMRAGLVFVYDQSYLSPPASDVETLLGVIQHFGKALEINRFWSPMRQKYNAVLAVLDHIELGICITNDDGNVVLSNQFANDLFDVGDGLWLGKDNEFRCRVDDDLQRLKVAIATISKTSVGENNAVEIQTSISRGSNCDPILAIASPLRDADAELEQGLSGCMITLIDTNRSSHARLQAFAEAYTLTKAEAKVAAHMLDGSSAAEIADKRNIAPSTVISQVKSILGKVGAKNRVQFVWQVFKFSPPVR
jgi:DNA-binding CsgD family transcriptional regulator